MCVCVRVCTPFVFKEEEAASRFLSECGGVAGEALAAKLSHLLWAQVPMNSLLATAVCLRLGSLCLEMGVGVGPLSFGAWGQGYHKHPMMPGHPDNREVSCHRCQEHPCEDCTILTESLLHSTCAIWAE